MGNGEGLVQVEVGDVPAQVTGPQQSGQGVEIGAVDVDLSSGLMDQARDLGDLGFEDAVRRGVGQHDRGQAIAVLGQRGLEVLDVDGAVGSGGNRFHGQARAGRGGGIGAVGARGNEAQVAPVLACLLQVVLDGQQPGQLALGARGRLEAHPVISGQGRQTLRELGEQESPTVSLGGWRIGMNAGQLGGEPECGLHGRIELECA